MENNDQYRNMTLSLKVTASQKAEYVKIASSLNLTISEWLSSIIEMNKNSYERFGEPTKNETKLKEEIGKLKNGIQNLKNKFFTSCSFIIPFNSLIFSSAESMLIGELSKPRSNLSYSYGMYNLSIILLLCVFSFSIYFIN